MTVKPTNIFYNFCKKLKSDDYKIFVFVDDDNHNIHDPDLEIIKINRNIPEREGFKSSVLYFDEKAVARDKALYYFSEIYKDYDYLWMIEEDVFIPTQETIKNIDLKYPNIDLLCQSDYVTKVVEYDWLWLHLNKQIKISPPYGRSMICAIRCSKELIFKIGEYAKKYKNLFLDEVLFNTICIQNDLKLQAIEELSTIVYRKFWMPNRIKKENLYHPIKDINRQEKFRNKYVGNINFR